MTRKQRCEKRVRELCQLYSVKKFNQGVFTYQYNKVIKSLPGPNEELLALDIYQCLPSRNKKSVLSEIIGDQKNEFRKPKGIKI